MICGQQTNPSWKQTCTLTDIVDQCTGMRDWERRPKHLAEHFWRELSLYFRLIRNLPAQANHWAKETGRFSAFSRRVRSHTHSAKNFRTLQKCHQVEEAFAGLSLASGPASIGKFSFVFRFTCLSKMPIGRKQRHRAMLMQLTVM